MQRVALLNGKNINQDYDISKILQSLATSGVVEGLAVTSGQVGVGYAFFEVTRDSETFYILYQNSSAVVIDTTGTKKVWIAIDQTKIDDGSNNAVDGSGIASIQTGASYPASNYIPLASITSGVITDDRSFLKLKGKALNGLLQENKSGNIPSTTTLDVSGITGNYAHITGTTTITGISSLQAGTRIELVFDGILALTHNATSLILPGGANIITAVGDSCIVVSEGSGNWRVVSYTKADGSTIKASDGIITLIAGETLITGDIVYQSTIDGKVYKTDSSNMSKIRVKGIISTGGSSGNSVTINTNIGLLNKVLNPGSDYYLSTTASNVFLYTNTFFDPSAQGVANRAISVSADGYTMFILSTNSKIVSQYTLSIKNNPTSATYASKSFSTTSQTTDPNGLGFSADGTKMYIGGNDTSRIYQYTLSTAWDVSTATYANKSFLYSAQSTNMIGMIGFKTDGTKMYFKPYNGNSIYQYTLSTAWDVSTASYAQTATLTTLDADGNGMYITKDGLNIYFIGATNDRVYKLNLSTAWDISTWSDSGAVLSVASQETLGEAIWINEDIGFYGINVIGSTNNKIYNYNYVVSMVNGGVSTIQYGTYSKIIGQAIDSSKLMLLSINYISGGISLVNNTNYVATSNGFVVADGNYVSGGTIITGTVNGVTIAYAKLPGTNTTEKAFLLFPVGIGQTYNVNANGGLDRGYFIPLI